MHIDNWHTIEKQIHQNRRKILFNPFYSKRQFVIDNYIQQLGETPNLDHPLSFTEKQNALKLNSFAYQNYWQYIDKYHVRDYVAKKLGGVNHLIPNYLYTKKLTVSDLEKLPKSFVLKTTGGSGTNYIVEDKTKENLSEIVNYLNWLSKFKYGYIWGEFFYNRVKPGIIAEKLLLDKNGNIPDDLKCFCFKDSSGTQRKVLYIERVIGDERQRIMFDENWHPVDYGSNFEKLNLKIKKPKNYRKILDIIDKLSADFNFVRVDLFLLGDKIYFGELTFTPTAGYIKFKSPKYNRLWGDWVG